MTEPRKSTRGKMHDGIRTSIGLNGDKTYQVKVTVQQHNGKAGAIWKTFERRKEAQKFRNEQRALRGKGQAVLPNKLTVAAWLADYIASRGIAATSKLRYDVIAARINAQLDGEHRRLQAVTPADCEAYLASLIKDELAAQTRVSHWTFFRSAMIRATKKCILAVNPTDEIDAPKLPRGEQKKVLSPQQIGELLYFFQGHELQLPLEVIALTGMRVGESCALRRKSLEGLTLHILGNVQRIGKLRSVGATKTVNSQRQVAITAALVAKLRAHIAAQDLKAERLGATPSDEWFLFPQPTGWNPNQPRSPGAVTSLVKYLLRKTKFQDFKPHDLRHAHISSLISSGYNPKAVALRVGDTVGVIMQIYSHLMPGEADLLAEGFARKVAGSGKAPKHESNVTALSEHKSLNEKAG